FGPDTGYWRGFSLSPDGRWLATASKDSVRLWDVATRREVSRFKGGSDAIRTLAFSPDSRTLAAGTFDGVIQLWNVASGQQLGAIQAHISYVDTVAFSPDGTTLASSSMDNTVKLWRAPGWNEIAHAQPASHTYQK